MSQNDFIDQIKSMDKKDRRALLEKLTNALTPEQQNQVRAIMQDKNKWKRFRTI